MTTLTRHMEVQDRVRGACIPCHRRKVRCDRLEHSCTRCLEMNVPCRYPSSSSSNSATRPSHERLKQGPRGPYKKGKTPREKELEDVVRVLTTRCKELEQQFRLSPSPPAGLDLTDPQTCHAGATMAAKTTADVPGSMLQYAETLSSPQSSVNTAQTLTSSRHDTPGADHSQGSKLVESLCFQPLQDHLLELWHIYMTRVEPLTKLVPYASLGGLLPLVTQKPQPPDFYRRILMLSVCFAAVNTLSVEEAIQLFNESKDSLQARFTSGMQAVLALPNALQNPSTCLFQALVLHAVCFFSPSNEPKNDLETHTQPLTREDRLVFTNAMRTTQPLSRRLFDSRWMWPVAWRLGAKMVETSLRRIPRYDTVVGGHCEGCGITVSKGLKARLKYQHLHWMFRSP